MQTHEFKEEAYKFIDWIAEYFTEIEKYPVKSQVKPREIFNKIPETAPENGEAISQIFADFEKMILPGITHWQHPNFHAFFPSNSSYPSVLAEMLTAAIGAQCMMWDTSPAAAELEEKILNWLRDAMNLPQTFSGVIQDSASSSTLTAIITAREKVTNFDSNKYGFSHQHKLRVYCSSEAHSSIEKGAKVAGIGSDNVVKIKVDNNLALIPTELEKAIISDISNGYQPCCVVAAIGTTGTLAVDPVAEIAAICKKYNIWFHIDAAFAGTALLLPEYQYLINGIEIADSFVFNPHKWMFTNFDCSVYFVKDKELLIRTFDILPEYLRSKNSNVNNYKDWGVQLGRRFRALKLWFVLRNFGLEGIRQKLREHIKLAQYFEEQLITKGNFEIIVPRWLNVICFRFNPKNLSTNLDINSLNDALLSEINKTGKAYLSHTKVDNKFVIRMVIAQTNVEKKNIDNVLKLIIEKSKAITV